MNYLSKKTQRLVAKALVLTSVMGLGVGFNTYYNKPITAIAAESSSSKTIGNLIYSISGNEAIVTGNTGASGDLVIPSTVDIEGTTYNVTSIGDGAFRSNIELTSVTIPDSVTSIGIDAFNACTELTSVKLSNLLTSIAQNSFLNCVRLKNITIPDSVISIGQGAFYGCSGLESVTIPDSVTAIGDWSFEYCTGLTNVILPNSVKSIGEGSFEYCSGLTNVTLSNSLTSIGKSAFEGCSGLTSIIIPDSVTAIGNYAFQNCTGLESVTIPSLVTSIGYKIFDGCTNLTNIPDEYKDSAFPVVGNLIYSVSGIDAKVVGTTATSGEVVIPSTIDINGSTYTIKYIGESAFYNCSGLTSIIIPDSVTFIGKSAFQNCTKLTSIIIPDSVTSIEPWAFQYSGLTSIAIPDSVTSIGQNAFCGCSGLTSITIPYSVTSIGICAFQNCTGLTSITIPSSVTSIEYGSFDNCTKLKAVKLNNAAQLDLFVAGNTNYHKVNFTDKLGNDLGDYAVLDGTDISSLVANPTLSYGNFTGWKTNSSQLTNITTDTTFTALSDMDSAVISVPTLNDIKVANGTSVNDINLPSTLDVTLGDNTTTSAAVTWDTSSYNKDVAETYALTGSLTLPEGVINPNNLTASVNVIVGQASEIPTNETITKVESLDDIIVDNGTSINDIGLPNTVDVTLSDSKVINANVTWENSNPTYDSYEAGTYKFTGKLDLPNGVTNPNNLEASVDVIVGENQQVTTGAAAKVVISGTPKEDETLVADLLDKDGTKFTTSAAVTYKWYSLDNLDSDFSNVIGDAKDYKISKNDVGKYIGVYVKTAKDYFTAVVGKVLGTSSDNNQTGGNNNNNNDDSALLNTAYDLVKAKLGSITYTNATTKDSIVSSLNALTLPNGISVSVTDSKLDAATYSKAGTFTLNIKLESKNGGSKTIDYVGNISKLTSSSSGHSSGGSSGGSSNSGSSSSGTKDTSGTQTTGTNTTTTATSQQAQTTSVAPINLSNITPDVAKQITNKVISNVASILGNGATVGDSKQIATANGSSITVTSLVKDGKGEGLVIAAPNTNLTATIPVDSSNGQVSAVYKYIPILGKYIQVTDGVTIANDSITLPTEANATYVAAKSNLSSTEVVSQGWVKSETNNWYMVDKTGNPLTGWQKDNTNQWAYLSPSDATMKTGWVKDGSSWYNLGENGYMKTGWVEDNANWYYLDSNGSMKTGWLQHSDGNWYYLNSDGSMAANTTVDGYTLDENGRWV